MPSPEPNSKMDELLRAYARKRKAQAGPVAEMHPVTRKLLHDEVRRTFASAQTPPRQNWRTWRWPLFVLWCGIAVMIVMFATINSEFRSLEPGTVKQELSILKDETPSSRHAVRRSLGRAAIPAASPAPMAASSPVAPAPVAASAGSFDTSLSDKVQLAPSAPPAGKTLVVATENFVQIHPRAQERAGASPPSSVLSNFRMRRSGQNVSIVDADGSVYNGQVLTANSRSDRGFGAARARAQTKIDSYKAVYDDANWTFNVTGLNNSLRQNIIFTGNVLDMPMAGASSNAAATYQNKAQLQNASNTAQAPSTQNSRIMGRVQVGGGKSFEIEAKPPGP